MRADFDINGEVIGFGWNSVVRVATNQHTAEVHAVKHVSKRGATGEKLFRFRNEAQIHRELSHPNIVTLHQVYLTEDDRFLVLEYLMGHSLLTAIRLDGCIKELHAMFISKQCFLALCYLHQCGIFHRDIKAEHLMFSDSTMRRIKLIDFSLAINTHSPPCRDGDADFVGTAAYAAPEVLAARLFSDKADVWAMGIVLKMMLLGEPDADSAAQMAIPNAGSELLRSFLSSVLRSSIVNRLTAAEALMDPWICPIEQDLLDERAFADQDTFDRFGVKVHCGSVNKGGCTNSIYSQCMVS